MPAVNTERLSSNSIPSTGGATDSSPQRQLWVGLHAGQKLRRNDRPFSAAPPELVHPTFNPGLTPGDTVFRCSAAGLSCMPE
jgi:hypothetical protein